MSSNKDNINSHKGKNNQKTIKCRNFISGNPCPHGKKCTFICYDDKHTSEENKEERKMKTIKCRNFISGNPCPHGKKCTFICYIDEQNATSQYSNTTCVVKKEKKVECSKGDDCKFFKQDRCTFLHTCPNNRTCRNTASNCPYDHPEIKMCNFGYMCRGRRSGNCPFEHPKEPTGNDESRDETEPGNKVIYSSYNLPSAPGEFLSETPIREFKSIGEINEEKKEAKLLAKKAVKANKLEKKKNKSLEFEETKRILDFPEPTKIYEFKDVEDEGDNQITEIPATQRKTTQVVIPKQQIQIKEVEIPKELKKFFGTKVTLDKLPKVQRVSRGYYLVRKSNQIYVSLDKTTWYDYIPPNLIV